MMKDPVPSSPLRELVNGKDMCGLRVLFIGHEASRSGAPIALLHLMRWLKKTHNIDGSCLLAKDGPLVDEFAALFPTFVRYSSPWRDDTRRSRILRRLGLARFGKRLDQAYVLQTQVQDADLLYCNTIAAVESLALAAPSSRRVLVHVHELEFSFRAGVGPVNSRRVLDLADRFVACSQAVADNLILRHGVERERVDVIHEAISINAPLAPDEKEACRNALRKAIGATPDTLIVGGSGWLGWRKGPDIFAQVAKHVLQADVAPVRFVWLGGDKDGWNTHEFLQDLEKLGIDHAVTHIPTQSEPLRYFAGFDIFLLTSREDPYPLVCLEAATCGLPIVCFDGAGGMPEFVESDCGEVLPYLDVIGMANAVVHLLRDADRRHRMGERAGTKVRERHDIELTGPKFVAAIQRTLQK